MDALSLFGLFAVTAMLVCYALEDRSTWYILAFSGACAWVGIRFPARRMALRSSGGGLGRNRLAPMAPSSIGASRDCERSLPRLTDRWGRLIIQLLD